MSGLDTAAAIDETIRQAMEANERAREEGIALARANALAREALKRTEVSLTISKQYPTSLIKDIARGAHEVNRLLEEAECAQAVYEASREEVLLRKRELTILEDQFRREWAEAGRIA